MGYGTVMLLVMDKRNGPEVGERRNVLAKINSLGVGGGSMPKSDCRK